jgi:hypothetical protein
MIANRFTMRAHAESLPRSLSDRDSVQCEFSSVLMLMLTQTGADVY